MGRHDKDAFQLRLRALYEQADAPSLSTLVELGRRRRPQVRLSTSSLSEWLHGEAVPRDFRTVDGLVTLLQELAARRGARCAPLPWQELHAAARQQEERPGRPRRPMQAAHRPAAPAGAPVIGELRAEDALRFEVHPAVSAGSQPIGVLPPYIERAAFDVQLRTEVAAAANSSRMVVVLGGSSTGKTRACWEAVRYTLPSWSIVHPLTPDRPTALLEAVRTVEPCTVLWLNEAQHYLLLQDRGGEMAAALQDLLASDRRGPVLVLGTMWPEYWRNLTDDSSWEAQGMLETSAMQQLTDFVELVSVPAFFTEDECVAASTLVQSDPRLSLARRQAQGGRITQYLAGAPHLWSRYLHASPTAAAVVNAAMDARRFGHGEMLREEFLRHASVGYVDDSTWQTLDDAWFDSALGELLRLYRRLPGPLQRFRPRPGDPGLRGGKVYLLADYLHERGLNAREGRTPAASLWEAATTHSHTTRDLTEMANTASRQRVMTCADLYMKAADRKELGPLTWFVHQLIKEAQLSQAEALINRYDLNEAVRGHYAEHLLQAGRLQDAERVARRLYEQHKNAASVRQVAHHLASAGQKQTAARLHGWAAEEGDAISARLLAAYHEDRGDHAAAERAAHRSLQRGSPLALVQLARRRLAAGMTADAERLCKTAASAGGRNLLVVEARERSDHRDHATALLYYQVAGEWKHPEAMEWLAWRCNNQGDRQLAEKWAQEATKAGRPDALHTLAHLRSFEGHTQDALRLNKLAAQAGSEQARAWLQRKSLATN